MTDADRQALRAYEAELTRDPTVQRLTVLLAASDENTPIDPEIEARLRAWLERGE